MFHLQRSALFAAMLFLSTFASTSLAIMSGRLVEPQEAAAKFTVMLLQQDAMTKGRGICTASVIAEDLVLTAAHCVINLQTGETLPASSLTIYFGNYDGKTWQIPQSRRVINVIPHPKYSTQNSNRSAQIHDIALIQITGDLPENFQPVRLLEDETWLRIGARATIAGFGNTSFYGDPREPKSRLLRSFEVEISNAGHTVTGMVEYEIPEGSVIDPQVGNGGMAAGDSGGPGFLMVEGEAFQYGVAGGYYGEDGRSRPSYERVPSHLTWLRETALEWGSEL